jgi:hypothetical protein
MKIVEWLIVEADESEDLCGMLDFVWSYYLFYLWVMLSVLLTLNFRCKPDKI